MTPAVPISPVICILFDECLGPPLLDPIRRHAAFDPRRIEIEHILTLQRDGVPDEDWIPHRAAEGWVLVTSDGGKGGNSREKGRKLPRVCWEQRMTHVILSPNIHQLPAIRKAEAIYAVFGDLLLTPEYPRGSRFSVRKQTSGAIMLRFTPLDAEGIPLSKNALKLARKDHPGPLKIG